jgi:type I restriction enzyme S subunit
MTKALLVFLCASWSSFAFPMWPFELMKSISLLAFIALDVVYFEAAKKTGLDFAYPRLTRLRAGNFVYPKLMAWEGAFGVVPPECDGCVVSTEFPVFEIAEERVLPEVLDTYFRMPSIWPAISGASTGTNVRRRRLNPQDFLSYKMPLPSRTTQEILRNIRLETASLTPLQSETTAELDALLPAILDRAFKGAL